MHQTSSVPLSVDFDVDSLALRESTVGSPLEWRAVRDGRFNLLLEGPQASTAAAILLLKRHLRGIVHWNPGTAPPELPLRKVSTLLVDNVGSLQAKEQSTLLTWTSDTENKIQIVAITTDPLFPLVGRGLFDERLYYRLNTIFLRIT
jgi:hypothetical protein